MNSIARPSRPLLIFVAIQLIAISVPAQTFETRLIRDIYPGTEPSQEAGQSAEIEVVGTEAWLAASTELGREPYVTDGSQGGTVTLGDLNPGEFQGEPFGSNPEDFTALSSGIVLFFTGDGQSLWASNGTAEGTTKLGDFDGFSVMGPSMDTFAFFVAGDDTFGNELWRTDGTIGGTMVVEDIVVGDGDSNPLAVTRINATQVFFWADDDTNGFEPWVSDGTEEGTFMLDDLEDGSDGALPVAVLTAHSNDFAYFVADVSSMGRELWRTDGTTIGTINLGDLNPGPDTSFPSRLVDGGNQLFFAALTPDEGDEMRVTDGTPEGTRLVLDITDGSANTPFRPDRFAASNGFYYFVAQTADEGRELWRTNGVDKGTFMLADADPGTGHGSPTEFAEYDGFVYYSATTGSDMTNRQLWRTNGSQGGTGEFAVINAGGAATPRELTVAGGILFFTADAGDGRELWRTDGTSPGTFALTDPTHPDSPFGAPEDLFELNGTLHFFADDPLAGRELCRSDGTVEGTVLAADINRTPNDSAPSDFATLGATTFFVANDGVHGREIWTTDGTEGGTTLFVDVVNGAPSSSPSSLAIAHDELFFVADNETEEQILWVSDGTLGNTAPITLPTARRGSRFAFGATRVAEDDEDGAFILLRGAAEGESEIVYRVGRTSTTVIAGGGSPGTNTVKMGAGFYCGRFFWIGTDSTNGREIRSIDKEGNILVHEAVPGADGISDVRIEGFQVVEKDDKLFIKYRVGSGAGEVLVIDCSVTEPTVIDSVDIGATEEINSLIDLGSVMVSLVNAENGTPQIIATDGTEGGSIQLTSDELAGNTRILGQKVIDGVLYVAAITNDEEGRHPRLITTNGTIEGTGDISSALPDLATIFELSMNELRGSPLSCITVDLARDAIIFGLDDTDTDDSSSSRGSLFGAELWMSDGTIEGTRRVTDINPGMGGAFPMEPHELGSRLMFQASDGTNGTELWMLSVVQESTVSSSGALLH